MVRRLELHQLKRVTSNEVGSGGANGKLRLWLPGFQNSEAELPNISDSGFCPRVFLKVASAALLPRECIDLT